MRHVALLLGILFIWMMQACSPASSGSGTLPVASAALGGLPENTSIFIRIFKQESELEVWAKEPDQAAYRLARTFPVCAWSGTLGPKLKEGDGQSPEGFYEVTSGALNPDSSYHLSFNLGFPNEYDRWHARTGSYLMVHGDCISIGCYAMTDAGIEEIYGALERTFKAGQPSVAVHIFPFRMSHENLAKQASSPWYVFWQNLKQGYDLFEADKRPPIVSHQTGRYHFTRQD